MNLQLIKAIIILPGTALVSFRGQYYGFRPDHQRL